MVSSTLLSSSLESGYLMTAAFRIKRFAKRHTDACARLAHMSYCRIGNGYLPAVRLDNVRYCYLGLG